MRNGPRAPGPPGHWLLGHLGLLRRDILSLLDELPREYGDVVALRFGSHATLLLSHPAHVEQVLVTQGDRFQKPPRFRAIVRTAFGRGLFAADGASWAQQRGVLQSAVATIDHDAHSRAVVACADKAVASWRDVDDRDLAVRLMDVALAIRVRTTLGIEGAGTLTSIHDALRAFMEYYSARLQTPFSWPLWVPTDRNRRVGKALRVWWRCIEGVIDVAKGSNDGSAHVLGRLVARDRSSDGTLTMSRRQLRDELATWLLTGTETTANTLAWTCYLLAQHPDEQERVRDAVDEAVQGHTVQRADLHRLARLGWVLAESMRLFPQAYLIGRKSMAPFAIDNKMFPGGTTVILNQWSIGRDPRWYDDPQSFNPNRWNGDRDSRMPGFSHFPFGGGVRACLGRSVAMLELPLVLAHLVRTFRFELSPDADVRASPALTLRPVFRQGAVISRRRSAASEPCATATSTPVSPAAIH